MFSVSVATFFCKFVGDICVKKVFTSLADLKSGYNPRSVSEDVDCYQRKTKFIMAKLVMC